MIRVFLVLALYIVMPVLIVEGFKRWTWVQKVGTVVLAYAVGIILALTGACSFEAESAAAITFGKVQSMIMNIAVPLAIPLMLFNCDFKLWAKALPKTIWALVGGIAAVLVAVISGYFIFRHTGIPEVENVAAMMTGIYTGGTMNFNALGASLGVSESVITIVLAFEMVLTIPYIFFIIGGGYKVFRKVLPYEENITRRGRKDEEIATNDVESYKGMFKKENIGGMFIGLGLSVLFLAIGAGLSLLLWKLGVLDQNGNKLNEMVIILTITTLAIIASFFKKVRALPKTFELGMFFILIFSVVVASMFNISSINNSAIMIGLFVAWILVISALLHLLLCRIMKVSGDLFTVGQVALLCSPPFVPPVVGAMRNKKVLLSGIVIGLVGYAVGTYLGVVIAKLLPLL